MGDVSEVDCAGSDYSPLRGVRVLDLCRLIPGAVATRKLADLGATVVKVEDPTGDYLRDLPPRVNGEGLLHLLLNRGKQSVALDLSSGEDQAVVARLIGAADVVVEGSRPGGLARKGVDLEAARREHPALVVCSITGFGQTGPLASLPSHGLNMDALAGLLRAEERNGKHGLVVSNSVTAAVELGALHAALAIAAAVFNARLTKSGVWIDISCWDAAVDANRVELAEVFLGGEPSLALDDLGPLYDVYETADGRKILFCAIEEKFWARFCSSVGRPDLQERWAGSGRIDFGNDRSLGGELQGIFRSRPASVWEKCFVELGIPGTEILASKDVIRQPHFKERALLESSGAGPVLHSAIRWADRDQRAGLRNAGAPGVGEHTAEVLKEWLGTAQ